MQMYSANSAIINLNHVSRNISLLGGNLGPIISQAILFKSTREKVLGEVLEKNVLKLFNDLEKLNYLLSPTFCDGIAGLGWAMIFLKDLDVLEFDDDFILTEFDDYLKPQLKTKILKNDWDQMHGAIGIALYFLKRGKYDQVRLLVQYLIDNACCFENELVWKSRRAKGQDDEVFNLGLAHGNAGILYFFSKCYQKGIMMNECLKMVRGLFEFFINNIQAEKSHGSFFCDMISCITYPVKDSTVPSRLAWCYGDLGILHTLVLASKLTPVQMYNSVLEDMLLKTCKRRQVEETLVDGYGICHGTAGLAVMYQSLYEMLNLEQLAEASVYWASQTFEHIEMDFAKSFKKSSGIDDSKIDILDGLSGVQLHLLQLISSGQDEVSRSWKEVLFLH